MFSAAPRVIPRRAALAGAILLKRDAIRRAAPNVQYAHSPELALAMSIANPEVPLVMHAHGTESTLKSSRFRLARGCFAAASFRALIEGPAYSRAAAVLVTADRARFDAHVEAMSPEIRAKCVRVPAMVRAESYWPPLSREPRRAGHFSLIVIGRLVPRKGVDTVLRALALLRRKGRSAELKVVGDGVERARLERLAMELGVGSAVDFAGYVSRELIASLLWKADVCISGSVQEGFSMTLLESLASGVPVVGFDVGGIADVVVPGLTGVIAKEKTPEALASAVEELLPISDEKRVECMRVANGYSAEIVAEQIGAVFDAVAVRH